ncbi:hypothetical protein HanIR_Chr13g0655091 [Helianthus annuus]|nr:hypothetical protein HanIR_Chr13g0655091 [Helianthus annuus]
MCANSINELSETLRNFTIHSTDMDTTGTFTGYHADTEEPMVFQAQPQEKPKPKKRRRILDWKRGRRKKPAAQNVKKTEDPKDKGKGKEIGESSGQAQEMPPWEELDCKLANSDLIGPADENLFNYPAESKLPVNLEPAIPDPIVNPRPLQGELEEWWTTDWQFQNLLNNPNAYFPQFDPEPAPNPPMSTENLAELRHYGEELVDAGN